MANSYVSQDVGTTGNYSAANAPSVTIPFVPDQTHVRASGSNDVFISFDGVTDHGKLLASDAIGRYFIGKRSKVWARSATVGAGTAKIDVSAETV